MPNHARTFIASLTLIGAGLSHAQDAQRPPPPEKPRGVVVTLKDKSEIVVTGWVFWIKDRNGSTYTPRRSPTSTLELTLDEETRHGDGEVLRFLMRDVASVSLKSRDSKDKDLLGDKPSRVSTIELKDKRTVTGTLRGMYWQGKTRNAGVTSTERYSLADTARVTIHPRSNEKFAVDATIQDITGAEVRVDELEFQLDEKPPNLGYGGNTGIDITSNQNTSVRISNDDMVRIDFLPNERERDRRGINIRIQKTDTKSVDGTTTDGAFFRGTYISGEYKGVDTNLLFLETTVSEIKSVDYSSR